MSSTVILMFNCSFTETTRLWSPVEMLETASSQHCRESGLKAEELHVRRLTDLLVSLLNPAGLEHSTVWSVHQNFLSHQCP